MAKQIGSNYGGVYAYSKTIALGIVTANVYHAFGLRTAGDLVTGMLRGFTENDGRIVDANIANELNPSGNILQIETSAAHNLTTNDIVTLANMNNAGHNGVTKVTVVDGTHFNCQDITYVAGAGASAGVVYAPAYLQCGTNAAGVYRAEFVLVGTAANPNKNFKFELYTGVTPNDNVVSERNTTGTLASMAASGNITLAAGDRVWLACMNLTDATDYTVKDFNIHLSRIG